MPARLSDNERRLRSISEAEWQTQVLALASTLGWDLAYHPYYSERSEPGWPDLVLVSTRRKRTVFAELKTETGPFRPEQPHVLSVLAAAGNEVYVWRPSHIDVVRTILSASQRPAPTTATVWAGDLLGTGVRSATTMRTPKRTLSR